MNTGMTVSGMTKDAICMKVHTLAMIMTMKSQITNLMMKLMMVNQDQASKIGSSATKNLTIWIIIHVEIQKLRDLPIMIVTGTVKTVRTNSGSNATGKNKTAHGWKARIKTGSEDTKKATRVAIGMVC